MRRIFPINAECEIEEFEYSSARNKNQTNVIQRIMNVHYFRDYFHSGDEIRLGHIRITDVGRVSLL